MCGSVFAWYEDGSWDESRCNICGKYIYTWSGGAGFYMPEVTLDMGLLPSGEKSTPLASKLTVCYDCREKYVHEFHSYTDKWVLQKNAENADLWEKYAEEHRRKMVDEKTIELQRLYKELLELSDTAMPDLDTLTAD